MKRLALIAALAVMSLISVGSAPAAAQNSLSVPVVGTGPLGSFAGNFTVKRFVSTADGIGVVGTLSGTVTNAAGQATGVLTNITLPVAIGTTTCEILHLDLGPL